MLKKNRKLTSKASEPEKVDAYLPRLKHPLAKLVGELRRISLTRDEGIGEEGNWNAPAFLCPGKMKPTDSKEYWRYIVVFNLIKRDGLRLVFPSGAKIKDASGLLEGDDADGRRLVMLYGVRERKAMEGDLPAVIWKWLKLLENKLVAQPIEETH